MRKVRKKGSKLTLHVLVSERLFQNVKRKPGIPRMDNPLARILATSSRIVRVSFFIFTPPEKILPYSIIYKGVSVNDYLIKIILILMINNPIISAIILAKVSCEELK
ncbi:MAG TPA: hypothetical protein VJL30_04030 [Patescibacteria group bacterium]|nr:hypothetical protein [Patescibacteria group bacterium]